MEKECLLCGNEEKVIKFYYGFWKTEYEPEKWCYLCNECTRKFQQYSHICHIKNRKDELLEFEEQIVRKLKK